MTKPDSFIVLPVKSDITDCWKIHSFWKNSNFSLSNLFLLSISKKKSAGDSHTARYSLVMLGLKISRLKLFWFKTFKREPHKMVKPTQEIYRQKSWQIVKMFDHFVGLAVILSTLASKETFFHSVPTLC